MRLASYIPGRADSLALVRLDPGITPGCASWSRASTTSRCWSPTSSSRICALSGAPSGRCRARRPTPAGEAKRLVEAWNAGALPLLAFHPASAGHGVNLQHGGSRKAWRSWPSRRSARQHWRRQIRSPNAGLRRVRSIRCGSRKPRQPNRLRRSGRRLPAIAFISPRTSIGIGHASDETSVRAVHHCGRRLRT